MMLRSMMGCEQEMEVNPTRRTIMFQKIALQDHIHQGLQGHLQGLQGHLRQDHFLQDLRDEESGDLKLS